MDALYESRREKDTIALIRGWIENFRNSKHRKVKIYDGISRKVRTIICPTTREQIIHHAIVQVMEPLFKKGMYEHSYAAVPGRGSLLGMKHIKKWIEHDAKNVKYCGKTDFRHYFESVEHDILKRKLRERIKDERFLKILFTVIDVQEKGLPLGFYTSQWLSNWFLQDLDHFIKENLQIPHYMRYMDDIVMFCSNKKVMHRAIEAIGKYGAEQLGVTLKGNYQTFRFDYIRKGEHKGRYLDFMGFEFYRDRVILRKTIMLHATRTAVRTGKKEKMTLYDCRRNLSYLGWIDHTDTYGMFKDRITPYVNIQKCKRRVSAFDKKEAKRKEAERNEIHRSDRNSGSSSKGSRFHRIPRESLHQEEHPEDHRDCG